MQHSVEAKYKMDQPIWIANINHIYKKPSKIEQIHFHQARDIEGKYFYWVSYDIASPYGNVAHQILENNIHTTYEEALELIINIIKDK